MDSDIQPTGHGQHGTSEKAVAGDDRIEKGGTVDYTGFAHVGLDDKMLNAEARQAADNEHNLSLLQAIKTYKRAALWSIRKLLLFRILW